MNKIQNQLKTVTEALAVISKQIEQIAKALDFSKTEKRTPKKIKKPGTKAAQAKKISDKPMTVLDSVFDKIKRAKNGVPINKIQEKTGLTDRQLSNALYKLSKKGKILSKARGVYIKNKDYKEK